MMSEEIRILKDTILADYPEATFEGTTVKINGDCCAVISYPDVVDESKYLASDTRLALSRSSFSDIVDFIDWDGYQDYLLDQMISESKNDYRIRGVYYYLIEEDGDVYDFTINFDED